MSYMEALGKIGKTTADIERFENSIMDAEASKFVELQRKLGIQEDTTLRSYLEELERRRGGNKDAIYQFMPVMNTPGYIAALSRYRQKLEAKEKMLGSTHPEVVEGLENLAMLLRYKFACEEAAPLYEKLLKAQESRLSPEDVQVAGVLESLGLTAKCIGMTTSNMGVDYGRGVQYYKRALRIWEKTLGSDHPEVTMRKEHIGGSLALFLQDYSSAQALYEEVLKVKEKSLGSTDPSVVAIRDLIRAFQALSFQALSPVNKAKAPVQPTEEKSQDSQSTQIDIIEIMNLGMMFLGNLSDKNADDEEFGKKKLREFRQALSSLEIVINTTIAALPFSERQNYFYEQVPALVSVARVLCSKPACFEFSYGMMLQLKGFLTESLHADRAPISVSKDPADLRRLKRIVELRNKAKTASQREKSRIGKELQELFSEHTKLGVDQSAEDISGYQEFFTMLKDDEALVDIYRYSTVKGGKLDEKRYAAVVVTPKVIKWLELGTADTVNSAIKTWRKEVFGGSDPKKPFSDLSEMLWRQIANSLPSTAQKVWLSPDGELSRIPWSQFLETNPKTARMQLSTLNSPLQLSYLRQRPLQIRQPTIMTVGDVDYNLGRQSGKSTIEKEVFSLLPYTINEIEEIGDIARGQNIAVKSTISKSRAVKQNVVDQMPGNTYIHLATHGFVTPPELLIRNQSNADKAGKDGGPLAKSGIVLAGVNDLNSGNGAWQAVLTPDQIINVDLSRTDLVSLSACETGRGEELTGQGVLGLQSAVMSAGSRSLLMSLWKVDDRFTKELMVSFYRNLWVEKMTKANALRQAQLQMKERGQPSYHWSAWTLVGEGW